MNILDQTPRFNTDEALSICKRKYGIPGSLTSLPSERDQNFLLHTDTSDKFVLKIANAAEDIALIEAQNLAMAHLNQHGIICPQVIHNKSEKSISEIQSATGETHAVRLVSYLPGKPYGEVRRHSPELFSNLGKYLGQMDRTLTSFDHAAIQRDFHWDLANALDVVNEHQSLIINHELRDLINKFTNDFQKNALPLLPKLRKSAIHNDANDYNVIVGSGVDLYSRNQQIVGVIDFGDMVHSYTIAELAVATAYAVLDKPNPLEIAAFLVKGYHQENPLIEDEISVLFGLMTMRLCMSVCLAAHQTQQRPDDEYLSISQTAVHNTLPKLAEIHPRFAEATFRQACGLTPLPQTEKVVQWLGTKAQVAPILEPIRKLRRGLRFSKPGAGFESLNRLILDLSIGSPLFDGADEASLAETNLTPLLFNELEEAGIQVAIGLYDEARLFYTTPTFATGDKLTDEHRTIHLGIDLFAVPGTAVYAPLEGLVYVFHDNNAPQDYGPVIILEHQTTDSTPFYTLYGHLNRASLAGIKRGQLFKAGDTLGEIGTNQVNGGWTPHLHFQIITDLL
ncbi:MAG: phosphotransferase, partial [Chloroflexi bacterium]|nr:phosphotransferase [Chloroflexota bacterium]